MTTLRPAVDNFLQISNATFFMDVFADIVDADDPSIHTTHEVILDLDVLVSLTATTAGPPTGKVYTNCSIREYFGGHYRSFRTPPCC